MLKSGGNSLAQIQTLQELEDYERTKIDRSQYAISDSGSFIVCPADPEPAGLLKVEPKIPPMPIHPTQTS